MFEVNFIYSWSFNIHSKAIILNRLKTKKEVEVAITVFHVSFYYKKFYCKSAKIYEFFIIVVLLRVLLV